MLAFTAVVSVLTGLVFGLFPALRAARVDLSTVMKESAGRSGTGFKQNKTRAVLVITEIALALILLVGAALLIRTYIALRAVDPGFDPQRVLTMRMSLTGERFAKTATIGQLMRDGRERLEALPEVEAAAASCSCRCRAASAWASSSKDAHWKGRCMAEAVSRPSPPTTSTSSRFRCCAAVTLPSRTRPVRRAS